jgi:predicted acyltransferase
MLDAMNLPKRSLAIDVLRGLTVALMIVVNMSVDDNVVYSQLAHAKWLGLTLTDLVFPTFLFVVGTALSLNLEKYEQFGDAAVLRKILTRTALIFLCGYLLYWFPFFHINADGHLSLLPIAETRIFGVLQRIALGYGAAALLLHYAGRRAAVVFGVVALLGYWALLYAFGDYSLTGNAALKLDRLLLGEAHMYHGEGMAFDPEGILSTLPAIVNVLAGYFAGRALRDRGRNYETLTRLLLAGGLCIVVALLWDNVLPISKKLWTSSYVLCTIGIDLYVISMLVYLTEIRGTGRWTHFFEVFGKNTLFIYLLSEVGNTLMDLVQVGDQSLFTWLYEQVFKPLAGAKNGALLYAVAYMLCCWGVAYAMDRRRLYIKL